MKRLLRGRTVRLRFTVLYTGLFLGCAVALLVLANVLGGTSVSQTAPVQLPETGDAQRQIHALHEQLARTQEAQSQKFLVGSLVALLVMAAVSVLLGNVVAGRVLRPLRSITAATRRISADSLDRRLAVRGPTDEVKDLADTIDGLLERLEASFDAQRRFVANASHELRTPLATMRASVDVALAKPDPAPPQTVALAQRLHTELDQVDRLLDGLLFLARAQNGALADRAPVSLVTLVSRTVAAHEDGIAAGELTLEDAGLQRTAWTEGSPTLLARLVDNVIDNAVVHNRDGGWIRIAVSADDGTARLVVETGGDVLDPAHVAGLGRPFQRLTADRTGPRTGSGLGLSIVAAIAEAHGGALALDARPEGGLRVAVELPACAPPQDGPACAS